MQELRRVLPKDDVDRLAVGEGALVFDGEVLRTHDGPAPSQRVDLAAVEIREPEFFAMRRIDENADARPRNASAPRRVSAPCGDEGLPKRRARAAIRVRAAGRQRGAGPDLPLSCGLVAVVLEHAEPAVRALEDVEAAPEEGRR